MTRSQAPKAASRRVFAGLVLGVLVSGLWGCGTRSVTGAAAEGAKLYAAEQCSTCHGPDGVGTGMAPALRGLKERYTAERLVSYLKDPEALIASDQHLADLAQRYGRAMPTFSHLDQTHLEQIAAYVLTLE